MFNIKRAIGLIMLFAIAGFAFPSLAQDNNESRVPNLPSGICDAVQVPTGNTISFHVYARGVQIYRWDGNTWGFIAPRADLFTIVNFRPKVVGIHHGGPIWESGTGSKVIGTRVGACTPDSNAIPWLLLKGASTSSPGIFNGVTYIQRVNTVGGLAPATAGSAVDQIVEVPYTTEYYFYRAQN